VAYQSIVCKGNIWKRGSSWWRLLTHWTFTLPAILAASAIPGGSDPRCAKNGQRDPAKSLPLLVRRLPGASHGRKVQGTITFEEFKALLGPQSST
jgi:hypothetical protein